ncbi:uncharacterized protein LOC135502346 [Lineus longissimus]|uniref:uncharacterized protein LOC135502346 n=1 Tax=Lineus longissimus TaxID=88925 RepID=UPI002B4D67A0
MENTNIFVIFVLFLPYIVWSQDFQETCSGDMKIECATGDIVIIHINQGERLLEDRCKQGRHKEDKLFERQIWDLCSAKQSCVIPFKYKMEDLQYLEVLYDCGVRHDLCRDVTITGNTSYLESPKFRKVFPYTSKQKCSCEAKFDSNRDVKVSFTHNVFNTSKAHVKVFWDNITKTIDNKTERKIASKLSHQATERFKVIFEAGEEPGGGHFQLSYETDKPITMVCNPGTDQSANLLFFLVAPAAFVGSLIILAIVICIVRGNAAKRRRDRANRQDFVDRPNPGTPDYATRESFASSYTGSSCSCEEHQACQAHVDHYDRPRPGNIYVGMGRL